MADTLKNTEWHSNHQIRLGPKSLKDNNLYRFHIPLENRYGAIITRESE
jgi:hypothetical protein